jgi:hypothetical protein
LVPPLNTLKVLMANYSVSKKERHMLLNFCFDNQIDHGHNNIDNLKIQMANHSVKKERHILLKCYFDNPNDYKQMNIDNLK